MATTKPRWEIKWKLDYATSRPIKVDVMVVSDEFYLERGEEYTTWRGNYHDSPADVFIKAFKELSISEQSNKNKRERLEAAHTKWIREV